MDTDTPPGQPGLPLTYGQFTVGLVPEAPLPLPAYAGSMVRGAFGIALQQSVCVTRTYECASCLLKDRCIYPYVFETPRPVATRVMRKYPVAPHPFVLVPPPGNTIAPPAQPLAVGLTLFGKALRYLPQFIFALERMGQRGLGGRRVRCALSTVGSRLANRDWLLYSAEDRVLRSTEPFEHARFLVLGPPHPGHEDAPTEQVTIELLTPLRIVYEERLATYLPFHVLIRSLLRRIAHLSYFHCGGDPSTVAFADWITLASTVQTTAHALQWFDWERYSNRQRTVMRLGGLIGRVTYEGPLAAFRPLLEAGEITHVGKGTSFGLGRYQIVSWHSQSR